MGRKQEDLTGKVFNKLTVIKHLENGKWLCKCDCGNEVIVKSGNLKNGHTKSCGCLRKQKMSNLGKLTGKINSKIAGFNNRKYKDLPYDNTFIKLYRRWNQILNRCNNKNSSYYKNGIKVCNEWKNDFRNFYHWAINNGFDSTLKWQDCTIDRINNKSGYNPNNCRWVNLFVQARNKNNNHLIVYNNEKHCLSEWAKILNCSNGMIKGRLKKGWSFEQIVSTPKNESQVRCKNNGIKAYTL